MVLGAVFFFGGVRGVNSKEGVGGICDPEAEFQEVSLH